MMLGNLCTRRCGFCAVPKGRPEPIDLDEPRRVAYAVAQLGLAHAVITSVNRDDDNLGAAQAFRAGHPRDPPAVTRHPHRGPHARLPGQRAGPARASSPPRPRSSTTTSRPFRASTASPSPAAAIPRSLRFLQQAKRSPPNPATPGHQDRHHRRPRRGDARTARRLPRPCRPQGRHPHHRPVPAPVARPPRDEPLLHPGRVRLPQARGARHGLQTCGIRPPRPLQLPRAGAGGSYRPGTTARPQLA